MEEIMSPMLDGLNYCIELNIISVVMRSSAGKFLVFARANPIVRLVWQGSPEDQVNVVLNVS